MLCVILLALVHIAVPGQAQAAITFKNWEFRTPLENYIGNNRFFAEEGTVIYDPNHTIHVSDVTRAQFYRGFIVGEAQQGFFLFDEIERSTVWFPTQDALNAAIATRNLQPLSYEELQPLFNLGTPSHLWTIFLYFPVIFLLLVWFLRRHSWKKRIGYAAFLLAEGVVIGAGVLWILIGLGSLLLNHEFGSVQLNIDYVVNIALLLFSVAVIWFMLYLHEEILGEQHMALCYSCRIISFIAVPAFLLWAVVILLTPSLPAPYWQATF